MTAIFLGALSVLGWNEAALAANFVMIFPIMLVLIPAHELGHALVGKLVGLEVLGIHVGEGRPMGECELGSLRFVLHLGLGTGMTLFGPKDPRWFRARLAAAIAAGPAVNGALVLACDRLGHAWRWEMDIGHSLAPAVSFMLANLLVLIGNLWPGKAMYGGVPMRTDGGRLIDLALMRRSAVPDLLQKFRIGAVTVQFTTYREHGQYNRCEELLQKALADHVEDSSHLKPLLACALVDLGYYEQGRNLFLESLDDPAINALQRAMTKSNIASTYREGESPEVLALAERSSSEALAEIGWHPVVRLTRGEFLIETGDYFRGIELVRSADLGHFGRLVGAAAERALCIAHAKAGDGDSAALHYRRALELDEKARDLVRCSEALVRSRGPSGAAAPSRSVRVPRDRRARDPSGDPG